jgi:uncharacterized protein (TIGR03000 family)
MSKGTKSRAIILLAVVTLLGCLAGSPVCAQSGEKTAVIHITIRLPADAALFIDEHKTQETGDVRTFRTPPLSEGRSYAYVLKATADGKTVTRPILVAHGVDNCFDLRADFLPAADSKVHPKQFASTTQANQGHYSPVWGAALRTVEQALQESPTANFNALYNK